MFNPLNRHCNRFKNFLGENQPFISWILGNRRKHKNKIWKFSFFLPIQSNRLPACSDKSNKFKRDMYWKCFSLGANMSISANTKPTPCHTFFSDRLCFIVGERKHLPRAIDLWCLTIRKGDFVRERRNKEKKINQKIITFNTTRLSRLEFLWLSYPLRIFITEPLSDSTRSVFDFIA